MVGPFLKFEWKIAAKSKAKRSARGEMKCWKRVDDVVCLFLIFSLLSGWRNHFTRVDLLYIHTTGGEPRLQHYYYIGLGLRFHQTSPPRALFHSSHLIWVAIESIHYLLSSHPKKCNTANNYITSFVTTIYIYIYIYDDNVEKCEYWWQYIFSVIVISQI